MAREGSSPSNLRYPAWQRDHQATLLETDPKKLFERVHTAEAAIFSRLQELAQNPDSPDHQAERQAIDDALANLRVLETGSLGFPDWKKE